MEATEEQGRGLLSKIIPPRLEDAGLEDCALPPDSIKEAFFKAATAVKSRASAILASDDEDDGCVADPWPDAADRSDAVIGGSPEARESPRPCAAVKGSVETVGVAVDDVVVAGGGEWEEEGGDEVVVGSEEERGEKDCVDGLQGLGIGDEKEKKRKNGGGDEKENGDEDEERPILVEGYV